MGFPPLLRFVIALDRGKVPHIDLHQQGHCLRLTWIKAPVRRIADL
jgi:hypothetical protein